MRIITVIAMVALMAACQQSPDVEPMPTESDDQRLSRVLDTQADEVKARYPARHPRETLEFFGVEPGMTLVEGLPGAGWYTQILLPYLGKDGRLIVTNYSMEMWPLFPFATDELLDNMSRWVTDFTTGADDWRDDDSAPLSAFFFGSMDEKLAGTADIVLFIRVLHNLANFEAEGGYLTEALGDAYMVLKPGGLFGVVQHQARDDMPDEFADGSHGYLKKQFVIDRIEAAGFEFVAESDINSNENDRPTTDDIVWRLPPSYATSQDNPELKAEMDAIGESHRMTLLFRKLD